MEARRAKQTRSPRKGEAAELLKRLRETERRLRQVEDRYELLMGAINQGFYDWNVADDTIYYSENVQRALGLPPGLLKTPADWRNRIHPDDLPHYLGALVEHFKGKTARFECDYRYRALDGSWRWARQHGIALRDKNGRAYRVTGATGDITELKQVEQALKESEERYALATRAATEGIYEWNVETGALFISGRAREVFGFPPGILTNRAWNERIHPDDFQRYRLAVIEHFKGRTPQIECEYRVRDAFGRYRWILDRGKAVRNAEGRVVKLIGAETDITQRKLAELETRRARDQAEEALAEQTAVRGVLETLSRSAFDLGAVLHTLIESATRLCRAEKGFIFRLEGDAYRLAVDYGTSPEFREFIERNPIRPGRGSLVGRTALEGRTIHIEDAATDPEYKWRESQKLGGFRTMLGVPLLREGTVIGVMAMWKERVEPFTSAQIALVTTFSNQALIAIENARLFNETKEALERQTATAEILRVISSSPGDVRPMLDAVAERAVKLCESGEAGIFLPEGERLRYAARCQTRETFREGETIAISRGSVIGRAFLDGIAVHVVDLAAATDEYPQALEYQKRFGHRSIVAVPLMREDRAIGVIGLWRFEVRPFEEKHIALVRTFADQAAIAIENVRLFNETKQALERQTVTAEILKVISSSPTDVQPVFDAIVHNAVRLTGALFGTVFRFDGELMHLAAHCNLPAPVLDQMQKALPVHPARSQLLSARAIVNKEIQRSEDLVQDANYPKELVKGRKAVSVPMLRDGVPLGAVAVAWATPGAIPDNTVALLQTFADQAAIAIENFRLFNETKEALEQQTANSEILRVISSSPSDLQPVFETILSHAIALCEGSRAVLWQYDGSHLRFAAHKNGSPEGVAYLKTHPLKLGTYNATPRAALERRTVHVVDAFAEPDYRPLIPEGELPMSPKTPTVLAVPLVREGEVLGVITIWRHEKRPFTDRQIATVNTFAAEAVIAIQNVRLFNETKEALERQTATSEILASISSSITEAQPVFDAIVRNLLRLFGTSFAAVQLIRNGRIELAAVQGEAGFERIVESYPRALDDQTLSGRAMLNGRVEQLVPISSNSDAPPATVVHAHNFGGFEALITAPMIREGKVIGALATARRDPIPFDDKQVALIKAFADQAVIAIENARLFNETKEALEQQTVTAQVLQVMSKSQTDVQPVFDAIVQNAVRLCEGVHGSLFRFDDGKQQFVAHHGVDSDTIERLEKRYPRPPSPGTVTGRALLERTVMHVPDLQADARFPDSNMSFKQAGYRSVLAVPMLKYDGPIGVILVARKEARPYSEKQIALLRTFADQGVIAIENVRLFNETKEALDQQKASAEILRVISSSVADTKPVFDTILQSCGRLFEGRIMGITLLADDGAIHLAAYHGPNTAEMERYFPLPLNEESGNGLAILQRRLVHCPDVEAADVPARVRLGSAITGNKATIFAPLLWEGKAIGAIFIGRPFVGSFSDKEIALLKIFADQAVIAIQNARLFREIQEKSRQLEIASRHKSEFLANMSHELRTPLNAIIGFARIVMRRSKEQLEPKQYENLEKIHASGEHLLTLINAILDLSKVEAGHVEVHPAEVPLGPVLEQCIRTVEPLVKADSVSLVRAFDGLPQVYVDEEKLRQIVINLLSNAAKFTERGTVRVYAKCVDDRFAVEVADTGIGIPTEKLEHIFEEFAQADASSTRVHGGTGLGLTIARRLARLMGGDIAVQSVQGKGSTFTLTLPLRYHV